jgi:hypothetical protein
MLLRNKKVEILKNQLSYWLQKKNSSAIVLGVISSMVYQCVSNPVGSAVLDLDLFPRDQCATFSKKNTRKLNPES